MRNLRTCHAVVTGTHITIIKTMYKIPGSQQFICLRFINCISTTHILMLTFKEIFVLFYCFNYITMYYTYFIYHS